MALTQVSTGGIKDGQISTVDLADAQITAGKLHADALDHTYTLGASGSDHYTFTGEGLTGAVNDPTLYLTRGKTYRFVNGNSSGAHPFRIQSVAGAGGTEYNTGVTNNAGAGGSTIIFEVPHDAPDVLYYICTSHATMNGIFYVTGALADGSVTTAKLAADAVTHTNIGDNAVRAEHINPDAVTTAKILDANVTTAKMADQAVTLAKLSHGTGSNDGKFLRANNGADPTFETVTSFSDDKIVNDISALALKVNALQNATRYNTNSTFVETFQDANGIASQTNTSRNSTGEYISSITAVTKNYYKPSTDTWSFSQSSTGIAANNAFTFVAVIKSANGSNWTYNGSQGGGILNLKSTIVNRPIVFNIGYASNNGRVGIHSPGYGDVHAGTLDAPVDKWVWLVMRTSSDYTSSNVEIKYRAIDANSYTVMGASNGGSNHPGVAANDTGYLFRHGALSGYTGDYDNTHVAHIGFWNTRLNDTQINALFNGGQTFDWSSNNGSYTLSSNLQEYFPLDEGSGSTFANDGNGGNATKQSGSGAWDSDTTSFTTISATGNFISNAITASASTAKMGAVITYIDYAGTATLNTDVKVFVSADNGSNFTQVTLVAQPDFATGVKMAAANDVTVTAGTQLKYKIEFANQAATKETRVTGISLQY